MSSGERVAEILLQLLAGKVLNKKQLVEEYQVEPKTIQRDMSKIRNLLENNLDYELSQEIKGQYRLNSKKRLSDAELLVVLKILLESRSLSTEEMDNLTSKLKELSNNPTMLRDLTRNEMIQYEGITQDPLQPTINDLMRAILTNNEIEFDYFRNGESKHRRVLPVSIYFSEYYFYLVGHYLKYNRFLNFRIDKMSEIQVTTQKRIVPYKDRFQEGDFRKRTQFAFSGEQNQIRILFKQDPQVVLDCFPSARICRVLSDGWEIEFEVEYSYGVLMWLLSQGDQLQVLAPKRVVEEMKTVVGRMTNLYREN